MLPAVSGSYLELLKRPGRITPGGGFCRGKKKMFCRLLHLSNASCSAATSNHSPSCVHLSSHLPREARGGMRCQYSRERETSAIIS